ncbi:alpha-rhamnosidase [Chitinophaga parva]|uniref:alpha-L-rhamnosidase n=1 Tax=Chitinophaga parva TaxID=2169414 RepID=A0A2T7BPT8_9BACT|nr:alpha-L-rhamnosidase [Chitinophaga parva]PUZ29686.1 alpha-rhamnosidase [Chitinophaga parva]
MNRFVLYTAALLLSATSYAGAQAPAAATLRCEYLERPLGIDALHPRLSWRMQDDRPGARQTAYLVRVGTDSMALGKQSIWNSGRITGSDIRCTYNGPALQPFTKYYWSVTLWDQYGKPGTTAVSSFETGMLDAHQWQGAWISDHADVDLKPAGAFRKVFTAKKTIRTARAYLAAAGLYELYLNGQRIGDHRLDPMYTRFDRRTLYVTYDVTAQLQAGENAIGVLMGNGWYNHQSTAVWDFHKAPWRNRPAFCMDLRITYTDGSTEVIKTDESWKTSLSPVVFNSIYTGEHYDARKEQNGWNTPQFNDSAWHHPYYRSMPSNHLVAQALPPVTQAETLIPVGLQRFNDSDYVYDLGRNIAGVSQITLDGPAGTVVRLKHGERRYASGHVDQSNIDVHYRPKDSTDPFQTDIYILNGKGPETFMPRFNYKGFQYVEVTANHPLHLQQQDLRAYFMHSNVQPAGHISSSDTMINKLWWATNNSYLSNLFGYPTDCPQREKNGWTGDAHIASETGLYNFDGITVYEKWLADHRDEQQPNGVLPSIIPSNGWGYEWGNGPDWTSTIAIIPWNIYLFYGDSKLLADSYENIKRYVDHITEISPDGLCSWGLGDWVPVRSKSPVEFTSTCYYYADVTILAKTAKLLGHPADYAQYSALATKIKNAFNNKYLHRDTHQYADGFQTELSAALYWGLVPDNEKPAVAANLQQRVAKDSFHLDVGLLGTKSILNALSENGYAQAAWQIASQRTFPSWGWWIRNGATTLLENWPLDAASDISRNHIMFGEIGAWLYKGVAGIYPDEKAPGFKNVLLRPHFVQGLDHFEAQHEGPYGNIISSWKRTDNGIAYTVTIPANSTASITLELTNGQQVYEHGKALGSAFNKPAGTYTFDIH